MTTGSKKLLELPKGWAWTTVGQISDCIQYGYTAKATSKAIGPKFLRITDIQNGSVDWNTVPHCRIAEHETQKYLLSPNDLVFARTGATVGKSFLIGGNVPHAVFASYLIRIMFNCHLNTKFVYGFFHSDNYWLQIYQGQLGIGQPNVNSKALARITIPFAPLAEQKRIVAKIEELFTRLDAGVGALKKVKAELKRYRQAVLKAAFEGKLTEQWRQDHKGELEPASKLLARIAKEREKNAKGKQKKLPPLEKSGLLELPESWEWTPIQNICNLINGRAFKPKEWSKQGLPIIRIQNLNNSEAEFNYCNFQVENKFVVDNGQLLFAWSGTPETSFGAHIWNRGRAVLNQHTFKVEIDERYINKNFLMYLFNHNVADYIRKAHGTAGLAHITKGKFESSYIGITPFKEQKQIVAEIDRHFSIAEEVEQTIEKCLKEADRLRQSILKRAFEGKLLPQDPTDEPAEKLLERIKAERARLQAHRKSS